MRGVSRVCLTAIVMSVLSPLAISQDASDDDARIEQLERQIQNLIQQSQRLSQELEALKHAQDDDLIRISVLDKEIEEALKNIPRDQYDDRINEAFEKSDPNQAVDDGGFSAPKRSDGAAFGLVANADGARLAISLSNSDFKSWGDGDDGKNIDCGLDNTTRIGSSDPCNQANDTRPYRQDVTTLAFSAPAAKSGDTSFATLDGLASGFKAELRRTFYFGEAPSVRALYQSEPVRQIIRECKEENPDTPGACSVIDAAKIKEYLDAVETAALNDQIFEQTLKNSYGYTFSASLGYDEFPYFPDTNFEKREAERISGSLSAGYLFFPDINQSFHIEAIYQNTFEAKPDATRCQETAQDDNDFLECATGAFVKPTRQEKFILAPQWRRAFSVPGNGLIQDVAIAPRAEYDFEAEEFSFDLPIYLVNSKKDGLVAGVRLGFEDEDNDDDFKLGVFYGKAFNLLPF